MSLLNLFPKPTWCSECENYILYLGDSSEIIKTFQPLIIDSCITDPPYGVGLGVKYKNKRPYESHNTSDTQEYLKFLVDNVIISSIKISKRAAITSGVNNIFLYPTPDHVGAFFHPAGTGRNKWGFSCWQPILYYGRDPYAGKGSRPDSFKSVEASEKSEHPCKKPTKMWENLIKRVSLENDICFDPFMGSGTTGELCVKLKRKFVGIEIVPKYFDISKNSIINALKNKQNMLDIFDDDK